MLLQLILLHILLPLRDRHAQSITSVLLLVVASTLGLCACLWRKYLHSTVLLPANLSLDS